MSDQLQDAIEQKLTAFTQDLVALYRKALLEAVSQVVGVAGGAPVRRGPGRPRKVGRPASAPRAAAGGRQRRSSTQIAGTADRIAKHVQANPGLRAEQIKAALKIPSNQWNLPIAKLMKAKRIKTTGTRRATKYFPGSK